MNLQRDYSLIMGAVAITVGALGIASVGAVPTAAVALSLGIALIVLQVTVDVMSYMVDARRAAKEDDETTPLTS